MSSVYTVRAFESMTDVVMNTTGSLSNWDMILTANSFTDWTPTLAPGQKIIIPDGVAIDQNTLKQLKLYPAYNPWLPNILAGFTSLWDRLFDNWILANGTWNGNGIWTVDGLWNAGP